MKKGVMVADGYPAEAAEMGKAEVIPVDDYLSRYPEILQKRSGNKKLFRLSPFILLLVLQSVYHTLDTIQGRKTFERRYKIIGFQEVYKMMGITVN